MRVLFVVVACLCCSMIFGQNSKSERINRLADDNLLVGLNTLKQFLSFPNYGGSVDNIDRNAIWCQEQFHTLGFSTEVLVSGGVKHVLAHKIYRRKAPTILFYLQIDGQPVDPSEWQQESPYIPVLKECDEEGCREISWDRLEEGVNPEWRIFARSASDSKGPAVAFLQALRIIHKEKMKPNFNIKVIMDFQEELGSPSLPALVKSQREKLEADAMLIMDGTRPPENLPTLTFGARGIATMKLTMFGAKNDLHSGQYGNYAPNPVFALSRLLGSMKDEGGRVLIPGYYDGIEMDEQRRKTINSVPENKEELLNRLGIAEPEAVGITYQESLQYPSLNVRGLKAAWVEEEVRTIIPSEVIAELDLRLVPETPADRQIGLILEFIKSEGFHVLDRDPTDEERAQYSNLIKVESRVGSLPFRTDLDSPLGAWLGLAMSGVFGEGNYIRMQATGGSQPIAPFINTLGIPAISVRIPNPDNNIHAPNENLRLGNFHEGLKMCLGILTQKYE